MHKFFKSLLIFLCYELIFLKILNNKLVFENDEQLLQFEFCFLQAQALTHTIQNKIDANTVRTAETYSATPLTYGSQAMVKVLIMV